MKVKRVLKRLSVFAITAAMVITDVVPALAYTNSEGKVNETQDVSTNDTAECEVYAQLVTEFKVIIPKKITLSGSTKSGTYTVNVEGDIGGTDAIKVVPDPSVTLSSPNLATITAPITQDKTSWSWSEIVTSNKVIGNGAIDATGITAGSWNGSFNFNISLKENSSLITVEAKNESGENLNASASEIVGTKKDNLLDKLVDTGMINSADEVDALIEIKSDEFDGMAETTFNVSNIANEGDKVTILHYNEETNEWEYVSTETVNSEGTITADFSSYSPVAFVKVNEDGSYGEHEHIYASTITKEATCTEDGLKTFTCYCGDSYTESITALGHSYGEWKTVTSPTCTDDGSEQRKCEVCGDVDTTVITRLGHDLSSSITKESTCTETGNKHFECSRCNYEYDEVITATGHNPINGYCTICNEKIAGLYDTDGKLLCTWEESGINVEIDYSWTDRHSNYYATSKTSGTYVLKNNYPTTTKVIIPEGVTKIGDRAFDNYLNTTNLISIEIPEGVTSIGESAFEDCSKLTSVTIPNSVTSIGKNAFVNCTNLTSATIPSSVTSIGEGAFSSCYSLTSVTIPDSVTSIKDYTFSSCKGLKSVTIPDSVTSIGDNAFYKCTSLTDVIISDSVTSIGERAFSSCTGLTSIEIPDSVTSIGDNAFSGCTGLTSIEIPDSVTSIGNYAFSGCSRLTSATIGNGVTSIGSYAFQYCESLTSVEIPEGVTSIKDYTFSSCIGLKSVTIPDSVTSIGKRAFSECTRLTSVTIGNGVTSIGSYAFAGCSRLTSATFKTTSGWYVGNSEGAKTTSISSSNLVNTSTAATYLKDTYTYNYWTR